MSRPSNQAIEQHYFEQFRMHYQVPDGNLEYSDKPDVIIRGERTVGIEIARLYLCMGSDPTSEQVQSVRRQQTLQRAQSLYLSGGGKRIELSVDFRPDQPICEIQGVAQALAQLAGAVKDFPSGPIKPCLFDHIREVRFVCLNAKEYVDAKWRSVQCYTVPSLSFERLKEVVSDKTAKAKEYQPCDTYWLLLVVDFMDRAQDQALEWPAGAAALAASPFDRVLLYKPQFAQVVRVLS